MMFRSIKTGDTVTRMLAGIVPMRLKVTDVTDSRIICGSWEFDRETGAEIDEDIDCQVSHLSVVSEPNLPTNPDESPATGGDVTGKT